MDELLARGRIYCIVVVFFVSCFLGLMSNVSMPMLAIRSVVITIIVGVLSNIFVKYVSSVAKTVSPGEAGPAQGAALPRKNQPVGHKNQ